MPDQTTNPAMEAAKEIIQNVEAASKAINGPRFLFQELINESASIISKHYAPLVEVLEQAKKALTSGVSRLDAVEKMLSCYRIRQNPSSRTFRQASDNIDALESMMSALSKLKEMEVSK